MGLKNTYPTHSQTMGALVTGKMKLSISAFLCKRCLLGILVFCSSQFAVAENSALVRSDGTYSPQCYFNELAQRIARSSKARQWIRQIKRDLKLTDDRGLLGTTVGLCPNRDDPESRK